MVNIGQLICNDNTNGYCLSYDMYYDTNAIKNSIYINQVPDINFQFFIFACLFMLSFLIGIYSGSND